MDADSFIAHVKTKYIYEDIAKHTEKKFDNSKCELERPFPKGKKSCRFNERRIRWKHNERICRIKSKNT